MKLGVFGVLFADKSFAEMLDIVVSHGLDAVEIGAGGFIPKSHCDPEKLLSDAGELKKFKGEIKKRDLIVSALSCHANMLHPDPAIAQQHEKDFRDTIRLCAEMEIDRVITFSGCPGDAAGSKVPNWVTCSWPDYFYELHEWQWKERLIPKWKELSSFAKKHGVDKIALEMHPGFTVYNPRDLLRLREAVGESIGANFDPSHLFWQGIDPVIAIRELRDCIFHFHAKDSCVNRALVGRFGVLETSPLNANFQRTWNFKTVGYGHGEEVWKSIIWELQLVGYDHVMSIEHEDHQMSREEGLKKAVEFLKRYLIAEKPGKLWFEKE